MFSEEENKQMDRLIAKAIHYPECWDTIAYPTLVSALWEMVKIEWGECPTCKKPQGLEITPNLNKESSNGD